MTVMTYEQTGCCSPQMAMSVLDFSWKDMVVNEEARSRTGQQKIENIPRGF